MSRHIRSHQSWFVASYFITSGRDGAGHVLSFISYHIKSHTCHAALYHIPLHEHFIGTDIPQSSLTSSPFCSRMRSEELSIRARSRRARMAVPLALVAKAWATRRVGAVPMGLVGKASCGWRCAIGIGRGGVARGPCCYWDWRGRRRVGGAVAGKATRGWRCATGIGGEGVAWMALCHWDCLHGIACKASIASGA